MGEGPDDPSPPIPPEPGQSGSRGLPLSLSVRRALFGRLLDSEHMLGVLRRALPALTGARIDVEKCKTRFVRSEEASREGKVHLLFKTRIKEAGLAARKFVLLGVAPVASGYLGPELDERSRALRDHPWVKPFCRLSSYVEDLRLALLFFPLDPVLPGLAEITGTEGERLLASFLPDCRAGAKVERIDCELQHYKPFERAVLRVRAKLSGSLDAAARPTVYVKLFADDRGRSSYEGLSDLWSVAQGSRYLRVPEPLGYDPDRRMLVLNEAPGKPDLRAWIKRLARGQPLPAGVDLERVEACLRVAAGVVRDLQRSDIRPAERRTFLGELAKLRKKRALLPEDLGATRPELVARFEALLQRLESLAPLDERLVPAHGSYRHKQMIGDEHSLTLVDWDGFCLANSALDAGTFLGLLLRPGGAPELDELAAAFRREILELQPDVGTHLALYEGLALTKRVLRSLKGLSRGEEVSSDTGPLAAAAEARLDLFEGKVRGG